MKELRVPLSEFGDKSKLDAKLKNPNAWIKAEITEKLENAGFDLNKEIRMTDDEVKMEKVYRQKD